MDKTAIIEILRQFRFSLAKQGIQSIRMILYGSYAKGNAHEDSDIDVVVISESFAGKTYWERIEILSEGIYEVFKPIEAVAMTPEEWENGESMIVDFARDGEVVFG